MIAIGKLDEKDLNVFALSVAKLKYQLHEADSAQ